jgi:transcriptional regulator with XRE-family HTH domain
MTGIEIKRILKNNGFSLKSIADLMGETPQNLNSMLKSKDVKTGVIERIATVIKKPLYFFYHDYSDNNKNLNNIGNNVVASGKSTVLAPTNVDNRQYYGDSPDVLKAQIDDKDKLLKEKDERIREKDERIREKDAYIAELKEIIRELKSV